MTGGKIKNIIKKRYRKLRKQFRKAKKHFDDEAIHQLRVEYKKLRAFLRLIFSESEIKDGAKITGKLKKCYALAGSVRDLQLQQKRILETTRLEPKKPWDYIHLLQEKINELKPLLKRILLKKTVAKSKKKISVIIPSEFPISDFKYYIEKILATIFRIIEQEAIGDPDIHRIRKLLKDLFYNLKEAACVDEEILSLNGIARNNDQYPDQVLEELGSYLDKCNAIDFLQPQWILQLSSYNQELLTRIKERLINDKIKIKRSLERRLKNELAPSIVL